jgi:hypothetical protein
MDISELQGFKKWSAAIAIVSFGVAALILVLTAYTVTDWGWGTQGIAKAIVTGVCLSLIFILFAVICIKYFLNPNENSLGSIFKLLSLFYIVLGALACISIFLPTY